MNTKEKLLTFFFFFIIPVIKIIKTDAIVKPQSGAEDQKFLWEYLKNR